MKVVAMLCLLIFGFTLPSRANARKWRVKPTDLASDYSQIIDQRPGNEVVVIYWVAPETLDANVQNNETLKAMLREQVIVGVAHGSTSQQGRLSFRVPEGVTLEDGEGKQREPIAKEAWPPLVAAFSTMIQSFFVQSMGQMGSGFHWFVFDGKGIDSCGKGRFWIRYASERYNYDTPIPGCAPSGAAR